MKSLLLCLGNKVLQVWPKVFSKCGLSLKEVQSPPHTHPCFLNIDTISIQSALPSLSKSIFVSQEADSKVPSPLVSFINTISRTFGFVEGVLMKPDDFKKHIVDPMEESSKDLRGSEFKIFAYEVW